MMIDKKQIPNMLSIFRLLLVPVFLWTYANSRRLGGDYVAAGVFALASATDVLDGYLARKNNWVTDIGKFLDPLADKLMQGAVVVSLAIRHREAIWLAALFVLKELTMLLGATLLYDKKNVINSSRWYGKLATVIFFLSLVVIILFGKKIDPSYISFICAVVAISVIFALIMYYIQIFRPQYRQILEESRQREKEEEKEEEKEDKGGDNTEIIKKD